MLNLQLGQNNVQLTPEDVKLKFHVLMSEKNIIITDLYVLYLLLLSWLLAWLISLAKQPRFFLELFPSVHFTSFWIIIFQHYLECQYFKIWIKAIIFKQLKPSNSFSMPLSINDKDQKRNLFCFCEQLHCFYNIMFIHMPWNLFFFPIKCAKNIRYFFFLPLQILCY